ncbi:hypothetical protein QFC24_000684 [Naganishia onofrii]|uniref:Uncharacterized protein n=1 Tax=Naganishia onofrii TaxID=1851511 RepID=A0ACC2XXC8_9TREE|nr:hypothetical protein QFC24_000684 [Naganishia onofrii]
MVRLGGAGFGSRTQGVIDDVEEMIEEMEERARVRALAAEDGKEKAKEKAKGTEGQWFPPPILATATSPSNKRPLAAKHGRSYSNHSPTSRGSSPSSSSFVTPYTSSPPIPSSSSLAPGSPSPSPSVGIGSSNRNRQSNRYEAPARRTSPLKHGFLFSSWSDEDGEARENEEEEERGEESTKSESKTFPPPRLATAAAASMMPPLTTPALERQRPITHGGSDERARDAEEKDGREIDIDTERTPRNTSHYHHQHQPQHPQPRPAATSTTPTTTTTTTPPTFSRAWLNPTAWTAKTDDEIHESVSGWGMVRKREMTPVTERTERTEEDERERAGPSGSLGVGEGKGNGYTERDSAACESSFWR